MARQEPRPPEPAAVTDSSSGLDVPKPFARTPYDRFDSPSTLVDPPSQSIQNACGTAGAYTANFLFESLGFGAYYLSGSLAALTVMLLLRREIDQPMLRAVGWVVSLVGITALAALV